MLILSRTTASCPQGHRQRRLATRADAQRSACMNRRSWKVERELRNVYDTQREKLPTQCRVCVCGDTRHNRLAHSLQSLDI